MSEDNYRELRLAEDFKKIKVIASDSTILNYQAEGDLPEHYKMTFDGKGLARVSKYEKTVKVIETHEFEIRLGFRYPEVAPEIRWKTLILHPNISYSGFVKLRDVGIEWIKEIGIDLVLERLWDAVRFEYYDLEKTSNYAAKQWLEDQKEFQLPIDPRPLRDFGMDLKPAKEVPPAEFELEDSGPIQLTADDIVDFKSNRDRK